MKITFIGALTLIFITLKLTSFIAWSWFWVLSPLWITILLGLIVVIIAVIHEDRKSRAALHNRFRNE